MCNITKNVKGEFVNKLTTPKLIEYDGKMPTNNMINSKSQKYPWFLICIVDAQIIDWICNCLKLIFYYEPNEHRNQTQNETPHTTQCPLRRGNHRKHYEKLDVYGNHLFKLKEREKDTDMCF